MLNNLCLCNPFAVSISIYVSVVHYVCVFFTYIKRMGTISVFPFWNYVMDSSGVMGAARKLPGEYDYVSHLSNTGSQCSSVSVVITL
jgi:hypothetical protein